MHTQTKIDVPPPLIIINHQQQQEHACTNSLYNYGIPRTTSNYSILPTILYKLSFERNIYACTNHFVLIATKDAH